VAAGTIVPITLVIENRGEYPIDMCFRGRTITFDVRVWKAGDDVVWQRLAGEFVPAILGLRVLAPGERIETRAEWDQCTNGGDAVAPGQYMVRGFLLTDAPTPIETAAMPLRIAPS
jgi:hypothetical protein